MKDKQTAIRIAEESRAVADKCQADLLEATTQAAHLRLQNETLESQNAHLQTAVDTLTADLQSATT